MDNPLRTILYVDDDPDIRTLAELALDAMGGFNLLSCCSGAEALVKAQEQCPDLILLDVMMPDMDGPHTLQQLRQLPGFASVPCVFMTAKTEPQAQAEYRALGAVGIIAKPFDPLTLAAQVEAIWRSECHTD